MAALQGLKGREMIVWNDAILKTLLVTAHFTFIIFALSLQVMFFAGLVALYRRWRAKGARRAGAQKQPAGLPYITTFLAAYDEAESLERNCARFERVAYPKDKCELLILTEEDDVRTNEVAARVAQKHPNVRHEIVPADYLGVDHPHNKPRALAYGLTKLRDETEVVGVLDAEDLVGTEMLSKVAEGMAQADIVQGRLAIKNSKENLLSYWCGAEYALLELLQTGRDLLGWMKIPRGTTYFVRKELVREIGWSTRNVTEDLAFNVRVFAQGHKAVLIETTTWEESPVDVDVWIKQRTRWFQGALQTVKERIDLSRLGPMEKFSVYQLVYHILLVPLVGAIVLPFILLDTIGAEFINFREPLADSHAFLWLWLVNSAILGVVCIEFATATALRYWGHRDLMHRLGACVFLPAMFMFLLPLPAVRACWREYRGLVTWEKTHHRGETEAPEMFEAPAMPAARKAVSPVTTVGR